MKMLRNTFLSITWGLNILRIFGFLVPGDHSPWGQRLLWVYWLFWTVFIDVIYIIIQFGNLLVIWGDLTLMVSTSLLLLTNLGFSMKIAAFRFRREAVLNIIDEGEQELKKENRDEGREIIKNSNREAAQQLGTCLLMGVVTSAGWVASAEKNSLPVTAWYPYDEYKSPAYEITYIHQSIAMLLIAIVKISMDSLVTSLMAVCRCRLRLLNLTLRNLCQDLEFDEKILLRADQEEVLRSRLRDFVVRHQAALQSATQIQACFSESILAQFIVSMIIICVVAYELTMRLNSDSQNVSKIIGMIAYLLGMIIEAFLYCYHGDRLAEESVEISYAAYQCSWYGCSLKFRRALLVVMVRAQHAEQLTAGGFSDLSLACFTSIMKASYSFFTMLQQVED